MYSDLLRNYFLDIVELASIELIPITRQYTEKKVPKKELVLRKGEICRFEGYLVEGCFKISATRAEGVEKILYFASRDRWVMEIDSFANQIPSKLDIQTLSDSTLLVISKFDKERLYEEITKAERLFRIMYQKAITAWQGRLVRNHVMTAEERYHHFITTYPDIEVMLTNKLIASYLGIT